MSAVSSSGDLLEGEDSGGDFVDAPMMDQAHIDPLVQPGLLSAYTSYMQPVKCINWRQSIPNGLKKKFSLLKNLKVSCSFSYTVIHFVKYLLFFIHCRKSYSEIQKIFYRFSRLK